MGHQNIQLLKALDQSHSITFDISGNVIEDSEAEIRMILARQ